MCYWLGNIQRLKVENPHQDFHPKMDLIMRSNLSCIAKRLLWRRTEGVRFYRSLGTMTRYGECPDIMVNGRKTGHLKWMDWAVFFFFFFFFTYGKSQESGILEMIPLISTSTRASIYSFCLKSVLCAALVAAAISKDLIVGNFISSSIPSSFTFSAGCNGLWLDDCSIICLLIWLANFLLHSVVYSLQPQKMLLSVERYLYSIECDYGLLPQ